MPALASLRDAGRKEDKFSWTLQKNLRRFVEENVDRTGHGICEMRDPVQYFAHGR